MVGMGELDNKLKGAMNASHEATPMASQRNSVAGKSQGNMARYKTEVKKTPIPELTTPQPKKSYKIMTDRERRLHERKFEGTNLTQE